ncbi:Na+/H+ antiporter NhaA [Salinisphaera shabanensis]|uniref:Na+/H+ antiporter NhaA n=1 Tax=Salinisphaera shabanensis TaxID=180542 RepID=UPI0013789C2F
MVGKPLGVVMAVRLATLSSRTKLPDGLSWSALTGLGLLAGVGFTIALFLTSLAFTDPAIASAARVGILAGSLIAALAGLGLLWLVLHKNDENRVAQSKHVA